MNNTPTPRERFRKTLDISTGVSELLADSNASYISWLERELAAVTEQLKEAQDGWHDEITKGLTELRRAESLYTKAQERAERAEEQRGRLAEALKQIQGVGLVAVDAFDELDRIDEIAAEALQSLNQNTKGDSSAVAD